MYQAYCRLYQMMFRIASYFLPWRQPELLEGDHCLHEVPHLLKKKSIDPLFIITDKGMMQLGLLDDLQKGLQLEGIRYVLYDGTVPNPTIDNIEEALAVFRKNGCKGIIAFGGGSPIDCAKAVGARVARPEKRISQMKGVLKVRKQIPLLVAIPTTAGTGSETTLAAVVSNPQTQEKYAINDTVLIPHYAVLDPMLTIQLPPPMTATTGMDALTHAVEAYIGKSNTKNTKKWSQEAVKLIFDNLYEAYANGSNRQARRNMLKASYLAGAAFTRAYVGNVHAIAHTLGGFYNIPHGLANAIILPYVLDYYGATVHKPLAQLADLIGITEKADSVDVKATKFVAAIRQLNESMNIPHKVNGIVDEDIPLMIQRALQEANPLYPVPKIFNKEDMYFLYQQINASPN